MNRTLSNFLDPAISKCTLCPVRQVTPCRLALGSAFMELTQISHVRSYDAGETIVAQGDETRVVGFVVNGVLKLTTGLANGHEQISALLQPSDFFGRVYGGKSGYSIEAATNVTVCCFERATFEYFINKHSELMRDLLEGSIGELDRMRERITLLACQRTSERLAAYLSTKLLQAERDNLHSDKGGCTPISLVVSRKDFASYLGTTPETISRNVQQLARTGVIRLLDSDHFEVLKRERLFALSGQEEEDFLANMNASDFPSRLAQARRAPPQETLKLTRTRITQHGRQTLAEKHFANMKNFPPSNGAGHRRSSD